MHAKVKDNCRKRMWVSRQSLVMPQLYMVQEMLAVFALFTVCFVIVAMVAILSMLRNCWKLVAARLSDIRLPVMNM